MGEAEGLETVLFGCDHSALAPVFRFYECLYFGLAGPLIITEIALLVDSEVRTPSEFAAAALSVGH